MVAESRTSSKYIQLTLLYNTKTLVSYLLPAKSLEFRQKFTENKDVLLTKLVEVWSWLFVLWHLQKLQELILRDVCQSSIRNLCWDDFLEPPSSNVSLAQPIYNDKIGSKSFHSNKSWLLHCYLSRMWRQDKKASSDCACRWVRGIFHKNNFHFIPEMEFNDCSTVKSQAVTCVRKLFRG